MDDISNVILPFLNTLKIYEQGIIDKPPNNTAKSASLTKQAQIITSIQGWQSILNRNEALLKSAKDQTLKTAVTHLIADALLRDPVGKNNVKYINGSNAESDSNRLKAISALSFGGGGSALTYTENVASFSRETSIRKDITTTALLGHFETTMIVPSGIGFRAEVEMGYVGEYINTVEKTSETEVDRVRSFTLKDSSDGDVFDVQV